LLVIRIPEPMVPLDTHHYHFRTKRDKMRFGVRGAGVNALGPEVATRKTPSPFEPVERARWPHPAAGVWSCGWALFGIMELHRSAVKMSQRRLAKKA